MLGFGSLHEPGILPHQSVGPSTAPKKWAYDHQNSWLTLKGVLILGGIDFWPCYWPVKQSIMAALSLPG